MKPQNTLLALTMLTALAAPASSFADVPDQRQVWRDTDGQVVLNTYGNCVRGIWENGVNVCGAPPAVVTYNPPPPAPPRTIIAEADRTVYFPFNVATLTADAQQHLDSLAQRINNASDVQDAQVVGYADRIGTTSYNEVLSKKRAENVRNYLVGRGVTTESATITRWVGKTQSNTQCPPHLSHQQLIDCLAPDRKVSVELKYKTQEETQPQTNAAPYPQDWTGQNHPAPPLTVYTTGENQPDMNGQTQQSANSPVTVYSTEENQQPAPPLTVYTTGENQPDMNAQTQSQMTPPPAIPTYTTGQNDPVYAPPPVVTDSAQAQPQSQPVPLVLTGDAQPQPQQLQPQPETLTPVQATSNIMPDRMQSDSGMIGGSGQAMKPSVETYPPPQPSVEQERTDAQPYMGQPRLAPLADSHPPALPRVYAQADPPQPSDEYRYRYLTTGE